MARKTREESLETRDKLTTAALEVMCEKPYSKVSMAEIASRVGLSKGAVYWHFANKKSMLIHLIRHICKEVAAKEKFIYDDDEDCLKSVRRFYRQRWITDPQNSDMHDKIHILFQRKLEWPEDVREEVFLVLQEYVMKERGEVEGCLRKAQERGEIRRDLPPGEIALLISSIFFGLFIIYGHGPIKPEEELDVLKYSDFLFDAFEKELKAIPGS